MDLSFALTLVGFIPTLAPPITENILVGLFIITSLLSIIVLSSKSMTYSKAKKDDPMAQDVGLCMWTMVEESSLLSHPAYESSKRRLRKSPKYIGILSTAFNNR